MSFFNISAIPASTIAAPVIEFAAEAYANPWETVVYFILFSTTLCGLAAFCWPAFEDISLKNRDIQYDKPAVISPEEDKLMLAVKSGDWELATKLLSNTQFDSFQRKEELILSILNSDNVEYFKFLYERGFDPKGSLDGFIFSQACEIGALKVLLWSLEKYFAKEGKTFDTIYSGDRRDILNVLFAKGDLEFAKALIAMGLHADHILQLAVDLALISNSPNQEELIRESGISRKLIEASGDGPFFLLNFALAQGASMEGPIPFRAPLLGAALEIALKGKEWERGGGRLAKFLYDKGAPINADLFRCPVFYLNGVKCTQLLSSFGANFNAVDINGETPFHIAMQDGQLRPLAQALLDHRANIDAPYADGETELHKAVRRNDLPAIVFLLANRAQILQNANNETPIDLAVNNELALSLLRNPVIAIA